EAETLWRQAVQECPVFSPAWVQLGRLWAERGQWAEATHAAAQLDRDPAMQNEAQELRQRIAAGHPSPPSPVLPDNPIIQTSLEANRPATQPAVAMPEYHRAFLLTRPARVSLVMMVKNEESNLRACLESARDLFFEIIIIDTG